MLKTYADLVGALVAQNLPHSADAARQAVELPTEGGPGRELAIVWDPRFDLVHVLHSVLPAVSTAQVAAVAVAIARVNHVLVMPGFGMDPERRVYFRLVCPRRLASGGAGAGGFGEDELGRAMRTAYESGRNFVGPLSAVARGELDPEAVVDAARRR